MAEQEPTSKSSSPKKDPKVAMNPSPTTTTPDEKQPAQEKQSPTSESQPSGEPEGASWGGWFTNQFTQGLSQAKEKSTEMFNYMKQDLQEFTETVTEAGRDLKEKLKLEDTAKIVVSSVGAKANVVLEQMSTIFGIGPDDDDEELILGRPSPRTRVRTKVYTMSYDDSLFLEDPTDLDDYERWMAHFDLEEESDETLKVADLLAHNSHLRDSYTRLVPSKVSHLVFWHRFYYLVHLMMEKETDNQLKLACSQPVSSTGAPISSEAEINTQDSLIGDAGMVEISEEDQKRLLAEYEEEMKKNDEDSGRNSRRSSGPLSSSSSSSFAFVTNDDTNGPRVE